MTNNRLVLAVLSDGTEITAKDCNEYIAHKNKDKLADFIYQRFYSRYLKPFNFPSVKYSTNYKNGFAIMASCCLLIETFISFTESKYRDTNKQSRQCFGHFFTSQDKFKEFAIGNKLKNGLLATPNDFYENVRCGILHNAETRNGWTITREKHKPYFNSSTKEINATKFSNRLKSVLSNYKRELQKADFDTSPIWDNFKNRLNDLIIKS